MKDKILYHGTPNCDNARGILESGIKPDLSITEGLARPVDGCVYLTVNLRYAIIYLLGGDMLGNSLPSRWIEENQFGYLFEVSGEDLGKINPDEDQVGQAIMDAKFSWVKKYQDFLENQEALPLEVEEHMEDFGDQSPSLLHDVLRGDYASWIKAGHLLLPKLTEKEKFDIINSYGNIAHFGTVYPVAAWKFDKRKCQLLKIDGSNFFELAEKIK